ncbi:hypothetical protein M422DRAFT_208596 [Sphaerobolus stellatus SS14]|uniref:Alpha/beta hydrolase fold-3 domain-containing protein n=1 Tax=Sphaerobolus stellatus (strain SS14) TaxID=990650 RepID=A0A0C9V9N9_SPHS4|nr:hypothetical protein M422DRAFT_208596 [Sphaerobolus stellatus SS14]
MSSHAHLSEPDPEWLSVAAQLPMDDEDRTDIQPDVVREQANNARKATDAVLAPLLPTSNVRTISKVLSLKEGDIPIKVYIPGSVSQDSYPVILWIFGGGFWLGCVDIDDLLLRYWSSQLDAVLVAVEYRKAPEHPFPVGLNDCYACLKWIASHQQEIHGDISKGLIVSGISSGGNFATVLSQRASQDPELKGKVTGLAADIPLLIHPAAYPKKFKDELKSVEQNKNAPIFGKDRLDYALTLYKPPEPSHPDMSPLLFPHLQGLPPTYIQVDGLDPLRDEALLYAKLLKEAGVPTKVDVYPGFPHGFDCFFPALKAATKKREDFKNGLRALLLNEIS